MILPFSGVATPEWFFVGVADGRLSNLAVADAYSSWAVDFVIFETPISFEIRLGLYFWTDLFPLGNVDVPASPSFIWWTRWLRAFVPRFFDSFGLVEALRFLDEFADYCISCRCMPIFAFHGRSVEHGCTVLNVLSALKCKCGDTIPVTKLRIVCFCASGLGMFLGRIPKLRAFPICWKGARCIFHNS